MLTIEKIKSDFTYIHALTGNLETYTGIEEFSGHGELCDVYFRSFDKSLTQNQVDIYNNFRDNFVKYLSDIERSIQDSLSSFEQNNSETIRKGILYFDIIEISQGNPKYDIVLICSKTYRKFLLLKKDISLRIEFRNGRIKSIKRKSDTTIDNED